jgi:hypothetical protein
MQQKYPAEISSFLKLVCSYDIWKNIIFSTFRSWKIYEIQEEDLNGKLCNHACSENKMNAHEKVKMGYILMIGFIIQLNTHMINYIGP